MDVQSRVTPVSEGLEILYHINRRGGCLLSELVLELGIPEKSVQSWIRLWCSMGHLKRVGEDASGCTCRKSTIKCVCCHGSCKAMKNSTENRVELTKRGQSLIKK